MKQFQLLSDGKQVNFNFPTNLEEITKNYLDAVTAQVKISDHHCLVGIVYHESLGSIIIARKQAKKGLTSAVVPIFIKAGNTDSDFIKSISCKDKLIISSAQLSLGYHVTIPKNVLSLDYFIKYLDKDISVAARYCNNYGKEECYFIEFKLIPNCDIIGFYDEHTNIPEHRTFVEVKDID